MLDTDQKETPEAADSWGTRAADGGGIDTLSGRVSRYAEAKARAVSMADYLRKQIGVTPCVTPALHARVAGCAAWLHFRHWTNYDRLTLHAAPFCAKHLLCPFCAGRRGSRFLAKLLDKWEAIRRAHGSLRLYLVTLTIAHSPDSNLEERFSHLRSALRRYAHSRRDYLRQPAKRPHVEYAKSLGGFHSVEVTKGENGYHPHVHCIWACLTPPDAFKLSEEWHSVTGDSYIVDVRPIDDPVNGFMEVCKYALKFSDLDHASTLHCYQVLSNHRLFDCHGLFRGVKLPDDLADEPLDGPYLDLFFRWRGNGFGAAETRWGDRPAS